MEINCGLIQMDSALIYAFQVKWTRYTTFYRAWHPTFGAIQWQRL